MAAERLALGSDWLGADDPGAPDALVFVSKTGAPIDGQHVGHQFKRLLGKTGTADRSLYAGGRHTTGKVLRALGVPLPVIRDILRRTRLATTEGYIGEANMAERFEAVEKLEGLLGSYLA